jgi:hypothetical protein
MPSSTQLARASSPATSSAANTTKTVSFTPSAFPALTIVHPQVWWPYQLGAQPLYTLATSVSRNGTVLDSTSETFGIRTVRSYLTGSNTAEPNGARAFKINGVPIVIRGGGYSPNLLLHYSSVDSYFGAQEENRPLHALYALDSGTVTLDNLSDVTQSGLTVEAKVYSITGRLLDDQTAGGITLSSQQVKNKVLTPVVPKPGASPAQVYFVELLLSQHGTAADRNVYWLSTWQDNDITLFPGESQTLTVTYDSADLAGATPVISVSGWNAAKLDIAAPSPNGGWESAPMRGNDPRPMPRVHGFATTYPVNWWLTRRGIKDIM